MTRHIEDRGHLALSEAEFRQKLIATMPSLRAFARRLCGNRDLVDDLAQETMMKAWAARDRFIAGTSFRAWTFTILRHHYFGQLRQQRHLGDYDEAGAEQMLSREGGQEAHLEAMDVLRAIDALPLTQREMLILIAIGSVSYEDIAHMWGVTIGTVKSRVARARVALIAILERGLLPGARRNFVGKGETTDVFLARLKTIVHPNVGQISQQLAWAA